MAEAATDRTTDRMTPDRVAAEASRQRSMERRVTEHVERLFEDRRFIVPTSFGPRPITSLQSAMLKWDRGLDLKRQMAAADIADFDLQARMPVGHGIDISLARQVLLAFSQPVGHVRYASLPPVQSLLSGEPAKPMSADAVRRAVSSLPVPGKHTSGGPPSQNFGGPMTLILFSGSGFAADARRIARDFVDGPPTILIEPNDAGGFDVTAPAGGEYLAEMLDPEEHHERARRVMAALDLKDVELLTGAVSLDDIAVETKLPVDVVESAARVWATRRVSEGGEPLRVKAVDGVPMLYRDSSLESPQKRLGLDAGNGKTTMPVMERLRRLFGGSASPQQKIAELAEQRAALSRQRDRAYEELSRLEDRENELRNQFMADESTTARRRITSQLLQLQKDLERRRQTLNVINQQINVIGTNLHNLEIARTGSGNRMPSSEQVAADAAKAEEVLAELQVSSELADEHGGQLSAASASVEEQRLFEELTAVADAQRQPAMKSDTPAPTPIFAREIPTLPKAKTESTSAPAEPEPLAHEPAKPLRAEPEPG